MLENPLFLLCLIMAAGYALGRIRIGGISLGAAGILLAALVFGHFGYETPPVIQNMGLVCFVTAVGLIAGRRFFVNFRGKARAYVVIGAGITAAGVLTCLAVTAWTGTGKEMGLGLLAGALTTTPGLAAGIEATGSDTVSVGYGIAYPLGVIFVVLFVQAVPKLAKADLAKERQELRARGTAAEKELSGKLIRPDSYGLMSFALTVVLGLLIGQVTVPLPGGGAFSLGTSGGPLFAGILMGHFRKIAVFDMRVKDSTLTVLREFGLALFLAGAGSHAGSGFVQALAEQGAVLFLYGALMTAVPLAAGYLIARKVFKLNVIDSMGAICGGMTSTPALGTLISATESDDVTNSYAATYPIALALIVILIGLIGRNG